MVQEINRPFREEMYCAVFESGVLELQSLLKMKAW